MRRFEPSRLRQIADELRVDLINTVAIADTAPTAQADAVSREIMARVDAEIAELDAVLATDIADIDRIAAERSIGHVAG